MARRRLAAFDPAIVTKPKRAARVVRGRSTGEEPAMTTREWAKTSLQAAGLLAMASVPALAQSGQSTTPEEWDALVKEAGAACQIASELESARVLWSNPAFEQKVAVVVTGKSEQPQTDSAAAMLCLFDKQTTKVEVQEMDPKLFE
jgi:hypothetical protein